MFRPRVCISCECLGEAEEMSRLHRGGSPPVSPYSSPYKEPLHHRIHRGRCLSSGPPLPIGVLMQMRLGSLSSSVKEDLIEWMRRDVRLSLPSVYGLLRWKDG